MDIKKIADYLYEVNLDDVFDYSIAKEYYEKYRPRLGGCSAISVGNIRGRNYDWEYSEGVEFIVRTSAKSGKEKRHASIGISSLTNISNQIASDCKYHDYYKILPFATLDGINDAGIFINVNVVGFQQMGKWEMKNDSTDDDLCEIAAPRFILDNCACLADVIKILDKKDWFPLGNIEETHFMVTGPRTLDDPTITTVVFEFIPFTENGRTFRKICCISNNPDDKVIVGDDQSRFYRIKTKNMIMTNFNLWHFDPSLKTRNERLDTTSPLPMGFERYESLEKDAGSLDSINEQQMFIVMKNIFFSNAYNLYKENFWYTDYTSVTKDQLKSLTDEEKNLSGDINKASKGVDNVTYNEIKQAVDTWAVRDRSKTKEQSLWETIHTSIFNYDEKSFLIFPHEGDAHFKFSLKE